MKKYTATFTEKLKTSTTGEGCKITLYVDASNRCSAFVNMARRAIKEAGSNRKIISCDYLVRLDGPSNS